VSFKTEDPYEVAANKAWQQFKTEHTLENRTPKELFLFGYLNGWQYASSCSFIPLSTPYPLQLTDIQTLERRVKYLEEQLGGRVAYLEEQLREIHKLRYMVSEERKSST
jgi:hypothetical protein